MILRFNYLIVIIYSLIGSVLGLILLGLNYVVSPKNLDTEKMSSYECGFDPFSNARMRFNIYYYLIAILFIVFDLEIIFLFPWAVNFGHFNSLGFFSMIFFLFILLLGLVYEWCKGALKW